MSITSMQTAQAVWKSPATGSEGPITKKETIAYKICAAVPCAFLATSGLFSTTYSQKTVENLRAKISKAAAFSSLLINKIQSLFAKFFSSDWMKLFLKASAITAGISFGIQIINPVFERIGWAFDL